MWPPILSKKTIESKKAETLQLGNSEQMQSKFLPNGWSHNCFYRTERIFASEFEVNFPEEQIMVRKFEAIALANYRDFSSKIRSFRKVDIFSSKIPENREFRRNGFELFFYTMR